MATKAEIDAAMSAIDAAMRPSLRERIANRWRRLRGAWAPSPLVAELREEVRAIAVYIIGSKVADGIPARAALERLAMRFGLDVYDSDEWGHHETPLQFDEDQLDLALSRARYGQIDDALHHLDRALPEGYGDIAERLTHAFRSAR